MIAALVLCLAQEGVAGEALDARQAAVDTARWIDAHGVDAPHGRSWPAVPGEEAPATPAQHLYSGSAGPVLFFALLFEATQDEHWRQRARAGARALRHELPATVDPQRAGLYTGLGGRAFVLAEVARRTEDPESREAAVHLFRQIAKAAREVGAGVEWNGVTDIISGSAGIGLALLWAERELGLEELRPVAEKAGRHLLELGRPAHGGKQWAMSPNYPRTMPNFSHGTAGVAYFLLELHRATGEPAFLEAAEAGRRALDAIADRDDGGYLVHHHEPGGEELDYLGWCHGPVGTARLFWRLWQHSGEEADRATVRAGARSLLHSGLPEQRLPGLWDNVSVCCGTAGVAGFFLDLHHALGDKEYRDFAERIHADLMRRATRDETGLRWVQAEHRVRPELLQAQTGYMQGAAGIGIELLRLDAVRRGDAWTFRLPDSPF